MASGTTSIWGRPYPLSSDAPSVHTDIQALANSLESVPLYPTTAVTSRTGVNGESVAVSPSQTLTLPASPVKGDRIQIIALGTVTGATPATVAGGGKVINGVGLSGASSFVLGTPNANATVQYDGTAWRVIDGQQDTGWIALTLAANVSSPGGFAPASYRLAGDRVFLKGAAQVNANSIFTLFATFPVAIRPSVLVAVWGAQNSTLAAGAMTIFSSGANQYSIGGTSMGSGGVFQLDGASYVLS